MKHVVVTGASSGIGLALSKQLVNEHGCYVYLGVRNAEKGALAVKAVKAMADSSGDGSSYGGAEFILMDVDVEESVVTAAASVKRSLPPGEALYALVNNAGTGFAHNVSPSAIIETNLNGPKRVVDAFLPILQQIDARIVNVGSGAGPEYVAEQPGDVQRRFVDPTQISWEGIQVLSQYDGCSVVEAYGLSKALLASYTLLLARQHSNILCSCLNPGFIQSNMTAGYGASCPPEQGTVSLRHCLFAEITPSESGSYYDSDGRPAPLHVGRDSRSYDAPHPPLPCHHDNQVV